MEYENNINNGNIDEADEQNDSQEQDRPPHIPADAEKIPRKRLRFIDGFKMIALIYGSYLLFFIIVGIVLGFAITINMALDYATDSGNYSPETLQSEILTQENIQDKIFVVVYDFVTNLDFPMVMLIIISLAVMFYSIYFVFIKVESDNKKLNLKEVLKLKKPDNPFVYFIVIGVVIAFIGLEFLIASVFKIESSQLPMNDIIIKALQDLSILESISLFIILTIVLAVLPAIAEEILFRGYMLTAFRKRIHYKVYKDKTDTEYMYSLKSKKLAPIFPILISSVIFGLCHMSTPYHIIVTTLMGVLLALSVYKAKSIYPGIVAHFFNNFLVIVILYFNVYILI